ncbi:Major facilitator superfamily (MFS) profile domain-containing protein [Madurella fahalii]|uniref:Major facilitator superfamily (MFS) profile domain-containing protein n=1 Tax=Madurella fahalii TaxID=1157608 RepID=A0ABQ0G4G6_9PEZI
MTFTPKSHSLAVITPREAEDEIGFHEPIAEKDTVHPAVNSKFHPAASPDVTVGSNNLGTTNIEARARLDKLKEDFGATWDGPNDPDDPYNWPSFRKVSIGVIFSFGQLITLMSASMIAAALGNIQRDLEIDPATSQIIFSTYFLGMAFAPFLIAAWAETNGRKQVWLFANAWYILWNALCPVGNSKALMIVGRLMTGAGASAGITLTGPVMADMYREEDRGKSLAIASFLPYLGPALGPIVGGLVTQHVDWPWIFWIMCIFDAAVTLLGLAFIRESYTPVLLHRKAAETVQPWSPAGSSLLTRLSANLARPVRLLLKRPVIQVIAILLALDFGIYAFLLSTFGTLYIDRYGESESAAGLHYIAISIGSTVAAQAGGHIMDWLYRRLRDRSPTKEGKPEFRAPWLAPGMILLPAGLFWYGWSAEQGISWVMVDFGAGIFTLGSFIFSQGLLAYQLDEFVEHGASANAASRVFSNMMAFAFPIFAPHLYHRLGYRWGNSLLSFIWLALAGPIPMAFWLWGEKLRGLGKEGGKSSSGET